MGKWPAVVIILLAFSFSASAQQFDWRTYPGNGTLPAGDYVTPVKDQGQVGTCWAFCAVGVIESKYAIQTGTINPTLDLSEQNVVSGEFAIGQGDITGGYTEKAFMYSGSSGITTENKVPYTLTNKSPNFPLAGQYTLYKAGSFFTTRWLDSSQDTVSAVKADLENDGPLGLYIWVDGHGGVGGDWYWPTGAPSTDQTGPLAYHSVIITGFTDDPSAPGGGYWHIKNSWGTQWGDDGYGYVSYETGLEPGHYVTGLDGNISVVVVPEPASMTMLVIGVIFIARKHRK